MTESLIIRHRPRNWDEVIGNNALINSLVPMLRRGDSHAFLFTGPSGCGKTTIARLCAAELEAGEVIEIDAATNNGVDDMRDLVERTNYQPLTGGARVIIIDECQAITAQAWRVMLKSVEEPPNWLYWVFCTTEINKVPSQIKTRCAIYEVSRLSATTILRDLLVPVCVSEKKEPTPDTLRLCADFAEGSPRKALSLLAQVIDCKTAEEAVATISKESLQEDSLIIRLARELINRKPWSVIRRILLEMQNENPETVRRVLEAYMTKVLLNTQDTNDIKKLTSLLDMLTTPIYDNSIAPIVVIASKWTLENATVR